MQQQESFAPNPKQTFNIMYVVCLIHQRALTIPMRSGYGREALGVPAMLALFGMVFWAAFSRDMWMWAWIAFWLLSLMVRRAETLKIICTGARVHSQYDGWPRDAIRLGRTEKIAKLIVEPIIIGMLGAIVWVIYKEQGWRPNGLPYFFLSGLFTLPFVESVKQMTWQRQAQSVLDARLEQQALMRDVLDRFGNF